MYLGLDIGTSSVKAVLVDDSQTVIDQATAPLSVSRLKPLWSEQDPQEWWRSTNQAVLKLDERVRSSVKAYRFIRTNAWSDLSGFERSSYKACYFME